MPTASLPAPSLGNGLQPVWRRVVETLLIFVVFSLHGAWPVPDVNEAHYLSKAKHYWNPEWCKTDFFVNTADAHQVFYWTFGWLTRFVSLPAAAWIGRLLTWGLLAFAWGRLSWAVVPRNWLVILGAVLFVSLNENAHMAGEWVVGGVEAKGFAYVLVLLGMEAVVRARWNWAWLFLGAATGMHAIVGGWSIVAAGVAWLGNRAQGAMPTAPSGHASGEESQPKKHAHAKPSTRHANPPLRRMLPGLLGGFLLALPGVWFAIALTHGADPQTVAQADAIYVWQRLPHHLAADHFQIGFPSRHMLLWVLWFVLITISPADGPQRRLRWMVSTAMLLAAIGYALVLVAHWNMTFATSLLRFYWFRMSDVFIPLGVTLVGLNWLRQTMGGGLQTVPTATNGSPNDSRADAASDARSELGRLRAARLWLAGLILVAGVDLAVQLEHLPPELACCGLPSVNPRADKGVVYDDWRALCRWAGENTAPEACFITPRMESTFRWYANRGGVVSWKDIPQDAAGIVDWWHRLQDIWGMGTPAGTIKSLGMLSPQRLAQLAAKYRAEYAIVQLYPDVPRVPLKAVYENNSYAVYRFSGASK
jgi:hypothetical protein